MIAVIAAVLFLRAASHLLIPLSFAVLTSQVLEPPVAGAAGHRVPRPAATSAPLVALLALSGGGV